MNAPQEIASPNLAKFMRLAEAFQPDEIAFAVDMLIAKLDAGACDPDLEDDTDDEPGGDDPRGWSLSGGGSDTGERYLLGEENRDPDGSDIRRPYRDRIRETRCRRIVRQGLGGREDVSYMVLGSSKS